MLAAPLNTEDVGVPGDDLGVDVNFLIVLAEKNWKKREDVGVPGDDLGSTLILNCCSRNVEKNMSILNAKGQFCIKINCL
jgi:hypothetical protein